MKRLLGKKTVLHFAYIVTIVRSIFDDDSVFIQINIIILNSIESLNSRRNNFFRKFRFLAILPLYLKSVWLFAEFLRDRVKCKEWVLLICLKNWIIQFKRFYKCRNKKMLLKSSYFSFFFFTNALQCKSNNPLNQSL